MEEFILEFLSMFRKNRIWVLVDLNRIWKKRKWLIIFGIKLPESLKSCGSLRFFSELCTPNVHTKILNENKQ
jgi:hypothetical protein